MKNLAQTKVGKIVASNFKTSTVFTSHQIDFCCGGGITLEEACKIKNQNLDEIISELEEIFKTKDSQNWQSFELDQLMDMIVQVHHQYVEASIPVLRLYLEKLCQVHGERHPELFQINELFTDGSNALTIHMKKEELVLFPYVKAMIQSKKDGFPLSKPHFKDISNPIEMMEHEHAEEGKRFEKIAELTKGYNCPPDGCQTFKVTYAILQEFEEDLHKHIHLENNILFPRAQELFNEFKFDN
ncbi:iron-sulfur cluster repair di-iron protein [Algoriphagus halophilus]|uniref:Regulator of cell morphogenesis and NO signaling n=1 Tax=Algoriphagus halophilus TaxID=226505 RepID=A0A1N6EG12_9BACT|nr:iron-sulfur cluster repair di-iron protein [Algoriphagus halophilus]SIN81954.1 regulator of cell morphogenesis and NO signaling [Algoriphagus halophilus]